MCTPNMPKTETQKQEVIATPTMADASVQKAGENARIQSVALAGQNIKTSEGGLNSFANTDKKQLMGG